MNPGPRREYSYRVSWKWMAFGILVFGAGAVFMGMMASENKNALSLMGICDLSPKGATAFYWAVAAVSALFVPAALFGIWRRVARPQRIVMDDDGLLVPKSAVSTEEVRVLYSDIVGVELITVYGERFMTISIENGKKHSIAASLLPTRRDFDEILEALRERSGLVPPPGGP